MNTNPKKERKRNRQQYLEAIGKAGYEGFMSCIEGGSGQPLWESIPENKKMPWKVCADKAIQEFMRGVVENQPKIGGN